MADVLETARPTAAEPVRPATRGTRRSRENLTAYLFLAPYLLLFGVFMALPIGMLVWMSLHAWDITLPGKPWVGLDNYVDLFSADSPVSTPWWQSMRATGIFTLFSVPLLVVVPLAVALVMNGRFRGRNAVRAVYFAPYVLGVAVIGLVWRYLLDGNIGVVNYYLGKLGLPDDIAWTTSTPAAWVALVGVTVWWTLGFNAVIYLAGLQDIPTELYDAAKVDGANAWQRFWSVTLPGLRPVLQFIVLTTVIASANMFGQSYIITTGAPAGDTKTAIYYISELGLRSFDAGRASAMSLMLTLCLGTLGLLVVGAFRVRRADR